MPGGTVLLAALFGLAAAGIVGWQRRARSCARHSNVAGIVATALAAVCAIAAIALLRFAIIAPGT
jgi:hypothetical protein